MSAPKIDRDPAATALDYLSRGWSPVPVKARGKAPIGNGWQNQRLGADDIARVFRPEHNIGVLLGEPSAWLVDVDLDSDEALALADKYLPPTGAVFGKSSTPRAHRLYVAEFAQSAKYAMRDASGDSLTLVELRASGHTVFPGSVHVSGQPIDWQSTERPAVVSRERLAAAVRRLGIVSALVANGYPLEMADRLADDTEALAQIAGPLGEALRGWTGIRAEAPRAKTRNAADRESAVDQYNREHARKWPRGGKGTCPICEHNDCFGAIGNEGKAFCFSASHTTGGRKTQNGWLISPLDVDAHEARFADLGEFLRSRDYLPPLRVGPTSFGGLGKQEPGPEPEQPAAEPPRNHTQARATRFMSAGEYMDAWSSLPDVRTVPTGVAALDRALGGGLPVGQVSQIIGGPGSRKSEFARQIRNHVAAAGHHVLHVDAELTVGLLGLRDIAQQADMASAIVRDRKGWTDNQAEGVASAQAKLRELKTLWTLCTPPLPVTELEAAITEVIEATKDTALPRLIILDSLQQLSFGVEAKERRHEIERFVFWANSLAQLTGSAVLITSERKRSSGEGTDVLHSAAESRSVEYQSAVVLVLEPEGKAEEEIAGAARSTWERRVNLVIAKNREGQKGKLPDALIFTGPSWGYRVEPAEDELRDLVIDQLRPGPASARDVAGAIKKNRTAIESVLGWLVDQGYAEVLRVSGSTHKKLYKLRQI